MDDLAYLVAEPQSKVGRWVVLPVLHWVPHSVLAGALRTSLCVFVRDLLICKGWMIRIFFFAFFPQVFGDLLMQNTGSTFVRFLVAPALVMLLPQEASEQVVGISLLPCRLQQVVSDHTMSSLFHGPRPLN